MENLLSAIFEALAQPTVSYIGLGYDNSISINAGWEKGRGRGRGRWGEEEREGEREVGRGREGGGEGGREEGKGVREGRRGGERMREVGSVVLWSM